MQRGRDSAEKNSQPLFVPPLRPLCAFATLRREDLRQYHAHMNRQATDSLQMVGEIGGLATARRPLPRSEPGSGFAELWACGALDLTVEAQILRPEAAERFCEEEGAIARRLVGKNDRVRLFLARQRACYTSCAGLCCAPLPAPPVAPL